MAGKIKFDVNKVLGFYKDKKNRTRILSPKRKKSIIGSPISSNKSVNPRTRGDSFVSGTKKTARFTKKATKFAIKQGKKFKEQQKKRAEEKKRKLEEMKQNEMLHNPTTTREVLEQEKRAKDARNKKLDVEFEQHPTFNDREGGVEVIGRDAETGEEITNIGTRRSPRISVGGDEDKDDKKLRKKEEQLNLLLLQTPSGREKLGIT